MNEGTLLAIVIPSVTVLAGILINNHRINDINNRIGDLNQRFNDLNDRFAQVEKLIEMQAQVLRAEFKRVEDVMDARLTRIEHELKIR